jgi:hypothetical protein
VSTEFFHVSLFRDGEPTQIEFFDCDELGEAKERAIATVTKGTADCAEVRNEFDRLIFRPFSKTR